MVRSYHRQIGTLVRIVKKPFKVSKKLLDCRPLSLTKKHRFGARNKRTRIAIFGESDIFRFLADSGITTFIFILVALIALLSHLVVDWVEYHGGGIGVKYVLSSLEYALLFDGGIFLIARVIRNIQKHFVSPRRNN